MDNNTEINKLWEEFRSLPFPNELHDDKYNSLDLELTDTFVAGCISSYLSDSGKLEQSKIEILKNFVSNYENIDCQLSLNGKLYFDKLKEIVNLVLKSI